MFIRTPLKAHSFLDHKFVDGVHHTPDFKACAVRCKRAWSQKNSMIKGNSKKSTWRKPSTKKSD